MTLTIASASFTDGGSIPSTYTCEGDDISPPLSWDGVPDDARSLVLIVDDPDAPDPKAPQTTWVHWILYNIPVDTTDLPEAVPPEKLPVGTKEGLNDWKRTSYGGPCPPIGRHRYFHKLYALDTELMGLRKPTKSPLWTATSSRRYSSLGCMRRPANAGYEITRDQHGSARPTPPASPRPREGTSVVLVKGLGYLNHPKVGRAHG